jgi:ubiquitin C-terminal hydrolase
MHEGSSDYGHYYSFIYDRKAKKWFRFNDYRVSEESEEIVFTEAFGSLDSNKKQCAYSLIYVNDDIAKE